jgi:uncharacterized membrane protein HdeD (DUF308 family)
MNKFVITGFLLFSSALGLTLPRNQPTDIDGMVELLIGAFVILMGIAITRVGLHGKHLGRLTLVSNVKKHPEPPRRHHRLITAGVGITYVLLGLAILIFQFVLLPLKYAPHSR